MPVTISAIEPGSVADEAGLQMGDEILMINDRPVADAIDFRFYSTDDRLKLRLRRGEAFEELDIEKDTYEPVGVEVEEFRIRNCGDDCIFCFVDQNPAGLRKALYFRDGDFRMSFLYGNYITMTNLRERDKHRIVEQRLSPLYISVHATDDAVRGRMMGPRAGKDDLMGKLRFFRDHAIEMHTQIVLVPGYNDGAVLEKTIRDLYGLGEAVQSVSIVPVGLTEHRAGLATLNTVTPVQARALIKQVGAWQAQFREALDRGFVYLSDEMFLLAEVDFPEEEGYDGYPLMENGVGMSRDFLNEFAFQQQEFPERLTQPRKLTLVTGTLPAPILQERIAPQLRAIGGLDVEVVVAENRLFGSAVTVSGLLNYKSFSAALQGRDNGDLVLLPPDSVNFEGYFLDNVPGANEPADLERVLNVPVRVFEGDWIDVLELIDHV